MKSGLSNITNDFVGNGMWDTILSSSTAISLTDLLKLSTDYSCHGCGYTSSDENQKPLTEGERNDTEN